METVYIEIQRRESIYRGRKNRKGAKVICDSTLSNVENRSTLPKVINNNFLVSTATRKHDISKNASERRKPKLTPEELRILEASQRGNGG